MTLSPSENRNVIGVPATRYKINTVCAHPDCSQQSEPGAHHCFRRSQIIGDSYFVSIDGSDPIPHAVGLCSDHHRQITDNAAWIRLREDGIFCWWSEDGQDEDKTKLWLDYGPLDPQPGQLTKASGLKLKKRTKEVKDALEEKKPRKVKSIRCPNDAAENGIELLDALIDRAAELIPHRDEDSPDYYVLMDALGWFALNFDGADG